MRAQLFLVLLAVAFGSAAAGKLTFSITSPVDVGDICPRLIDALGTAVDRAKVTDDVDVAPACSRSGRTHTLTITMATTAASDALTIKVQGILNVFVSRGLPCDSTISITGKTGGTRSVSCSGGSGSKTYASKALCCSSRGGSTGGGSTTTTTTTFPVNIAITTKGTKNCRNVLSAFNSLLNELGLGSRLRRSATCRVSGSRVLITSSFRDRASATTFVNAWVNDAGYMTDLAGIECGSTILIDAARSAGTKTLSCDNVDELCCDNSGGGGGTGVASVIFTIYGSKLNCDDLQTAVENLLGEDVTDVSGDCSTSDDGSVAEINLEAGSSSDAALVKTLLELYAADFVIDGKIACGSEVYLDTPAGSVAVACPKAGITGAIGLSTLCCDSTGGTSPPPSPAPPGPGKRTDNYLTIDAIGAFSCDVAAVALNEMILVAGMASKIDTAPFCIKSMLPGRSYIGWGFASSTDSAAFGATLTANINNFLTAAKIPCGSTLSAAIANAPSYTTFSCTTSGFPNSIAAPALCCIAPPPSPSPSPAGPPVRPILTTRSQAVISVSNVPPAICNNAAALAQLASEQGQQYLRQLIAERLKISNILKEDARLVTSSAKCVPAGSAPKDAFTIPVRRLMQDSGFVLVFFFEIEIVTTYREPGQPADIAALVKVAGDNAAKETCRWLLAGPVATLVNSLGLGRATCEDPRLSVAATGVYGTARRLASADASWWEEPEVFEDAADWLD